MMCTPKAGHLWGGYTFFMAKKDKKFKKYSAEFKLSVILDMHEHNLGYQEAV